MTSNRDALVAYYIQGGATKLVQYAESTINKKKPKKNSGNQQSSEFNASVFNFLILKPYTISPDYFNQQILNSMQGKTRFNSLFKSQSNQYQKDIQSFKVLYNKYLNHPRVIKEYQNQSLLLRKNIDFNFGEKLFNKELEITQIADNLRQVEKTIRQIKTLALNKYNELIYKQIQKKLLIRRTQRQNYDYCTEQSLELQKLYRSFKKVENVSKILQQSEQIISKIINQTIYRWFSRLIDVANLNQLLSTPNMIVQWEDSLIQKEKYQLMAQQISGKLLFSIQQTINKMKMTTNPLDYTKQASLRQKRSGVHQQSFQRQKTFSSKQFESVNSQKQKDRISFYPKQASFEPKGSYQKMANRINNLTVNAQSNNPLIKNKSKVEIRFPIKIDNFQMQSWSSSFLIYKAQNINLKQLPLNFIKDRHKFGQNRVKIEYPCRPEEHTTEMVAKSMQILNCLGAQVYCQEQVSYKSVNQIDSAQILAISWLLQRPVKQVIKYYGQHFAGCPTAKK